MLVIAGLPLFFIELAVGQFASEGPITVWGMAPAFMGIGYAMIIISAVVSIYYNMIITYAIYYMLVSFVHLDVDLPWENCGQLWNTEKCRDESFPRLEELDRENATAALWREIYDRNCTELKFKQDTWDDPSQYPKWIEDFIAYANSSMSVDYYNTTQNITDDLEWETVRKFDGLKGCKIAWESPSEQYWSRYVLQVQDSEDLGDLGNVSLKLLFTLVLAWLLIFGCLMKGIKTSGKVVYFTATFPYVILVVLLVRGLTLEGYEDGIEFYVVPEWKKLKQAKIWGDAATQIFYSLGIGFGGLLTMASYNKFKNNCYRDAILVALINCGTSIFAGFAIFSLLGHMAYVTGQNVKDVATLGPGLAFVAYPDGISRLPASPVWAFLFFFMILTLGMDSQFAMMETVISGISDIFPRYLRKNKTTFTFICCVIGFLLGVPQCMDGGIRVLTLMNDYSGSYNLMVVALFEIICLCYVYGINEFRKDVEMMIGFMPGPYWIVNWFVITPAAVIFIIIISAIQYEVSGYDDQKFESWAEGIGWAMVGVPIFVMVLIMLIQICRLGLKESFSPSATWGPSQPEDRTGRYSPLHTEFDDTHALPYVVDGKQEPPPNYNGHASYDNPAAQKYMSERL
ncbi:hypothetical protein EGW08_015412 [Elysia chlorotica]|uniref:Transporter n=1 Tax=Elysia chlorotica TaxID=188477 RepID=A0A3S0ZKB7_ELYCH|nr:hypothetical protein EGW08_015412 [Elysia chlorotica]